MRVEPVAKTSTSWMDWLGRGLMALAALSALIAFLSGIPAIQSAAPDTIWVETWRFFGFAVFAGMFSLLALRPRASAGIWELAFFHKTAMAFSSLVLSGAREAAAAGAIDAILAGVILLAYVLTRGWTAWKNN